MKVQIFKDGQLQRVEFITSLQFYLQFKEFMTPVSIQKMLAIWNNNQNGWTHVLA